MFDLCTDSAFWLGLKIVMKHIGPLLIAVRAVECEQTKLDRVFKLLGYLYQHFLQVGDEKVKKVMLHGLEKRFSDYDQPALLIAYMLNPHSDHAPGFQTRRTASTVVEPWSSKRQASSASWLYV
ncbi:hypothetical protein ABBQ38_006376 [Trebouxia sp. C0009 RCD-2024]